MFGIYDSNGDLYAYADTRRDADKALKEVPGGRAVDLSRPGLEGPFRTPRRSMVYYDPREGRYYDPDSDMFLDRDADPFRRNPTDPLEGGNDYFVGVYRSAVMGGEHEPKEASQEYRRGYREGAAIARKHPDAVAYAQGYHEAAHDLPRAGQMLINHVRELEERSGSKRRNPGMSQKTAKQFLATMPTGITLDVNGKRVRRVGDDHYAIDGVRYTSAQACKRIA